MVASGLKVFDATCPLVTKVHVEVAKMRNQAREVVMIGHKGHPEVEGTMGQSRDGMYLVETPEDVRNLKVGTPDKPLLRHPDHALGRRCLGRYCRAQGTVPRNPGAEEGRHLLRDAESAGCRQGAGRTMRPGHRRRQPEQFELAAPQGSRGGARDRWLPDRRAGRNRPEWLDGKNRIGVTAGASAPEILVQRVVDRIRALTGARTEQLAGIEEGVSFPLPKELALTAN